MKNSIEHKTVVTALSYHRNGIAGAGFHVAIIDDPINGKMVAIRFADTDETGIQCAVLNINELAKENIEFAEGNSWRGDCYTDIVDEAIEKDDY